MVNEAIPNLDMSVSETIARWPATRAILAERGLDLCCGGVHPVAMAAAAHGVNPEILLAELRLAAGGIRA